MKFYLIRSEIVQKYLKIRSLTIDICKDLSNEDNNLQSSEEVSPNKWHLAHTSWFFETFVLEKYQPNFKYYNKNWLYYLNSYYENKGKRITKSDRAKISRPGIQEILNYRKIIDSSVLELMTKNDDQNLLYRIDLGLNHEQQHQELMLQDTKLNLFSGLNGSYFRKKPAYLEHKHSDKFIEFEEGIFEFGTNRPEFHFDNEEKRHKRYVYPFKLAISPVTNGEYLEFVRSKSFKDPNNWLSNGWNWKNSKNLLLPLYWIEQDGEFFEYTLNGLEKLEENKPLSHISYYEAWAYARAKSMRLPTEFELELALENYKTENPNLLDEISNSHLDAIGTDKISFLGNIWEWTSSPYSPYPGYSQENGPLGEYNGKFMDGQYVLKGGSSLTPSSHISNTYRNFYHPEKRWMQAGFRLAKDI